MAELVPHIVYSRRRNGKFFMCGKDKAVYHFYGEEKCPICKRELNEATPERVAELSEKVRLLEITVRTMREWINFDRCEKCGEIVLHGFMCAKCQHVNEGG